MHAEDAADAMRALLALSKPAAGSLVRFADALTSQYEVTYKRPAGTKAQSVQVGVARQNLKLHATAWAPQ